jgi:hypothetical protein
MGNICRTQTESDEEQPEAFPAQSGLELDWNDEASVHRRTVMNCLDNYALGKIVEESLVDSRGGNARKPKKNIPNLKFADQLEQTSVHDYSEGHRRIEETSSDLIKAC